MVFAVTSLGALEQKNIDAELDGVLTVQDRDAIAELVIAVRSNGFGPVQSKLELEAALKIDERKPIVGRIGLARVLM